MEENLPENKLNARENRRGKSIKIKKGEQLVEGIFIQLLVYATLS